MIGISHPALLKFSVRGASHFSPTYYFSPSARQGYVVEVNRPVGSLLLAGRALRPCLGLVVVAGDTCFFCLRGLLGLEADIICQYQSSGRRGCLNLSLSGHMCVLQFMLLIGRTIFKNEGIDRKQAALIMTGVTAR